MAFRATFLGDAPFQSGVHAILEHRCAQKGALTVSTAFLAVRSSNVASARDGCNDEPLAVIRQDNLDLLGIIDSILAQHEASLLASIKRGVSNPRLRLF